MNSVFVVLLTIVFFGAIVAAMAVGVIFRGKCMRGSCGGEAILGPNGELLNCDTCPIRKDKDALARASTQGTRVPTSKSPT